MFTNWPPESREELKLALEHGMWVAPTACGLEASRAHTSIVVLSPVTGTIALTFELPGKYNQERVDEWMEEASERFLSPLCCAVDAEIAPLALHDHIPLGNCYWVRYPGIYRQPEWQGQADDAQERGESTPRSHFKALALARRLYADFHDFEAIHMDLHCLEDSAKRLRCMLHRSFVPDLQYVIARCQSKVKF